MEKHRNSIEYVIYGDYALFSEVATRTGGEKNSYQIPTYQALKGITESIYWKPTIVWVIDAVRVMNKIQTEGKGIRPIKMSGGNQVLAHFEWNEQREDLRVDRNENKHHNIAKRSVNLGGRRDIFLGTRECQGYVEPCEFGSGEGFYDGYGDWQFGFEFHSFIYPDENPEHDFIAQFWRPIMHDGIIQFERPDSTQLDQRIIRRNQHVKDFIEGRNFSMAEE